MDILMPQLGETVAEGKITRWYKATGDAVQPGDNLFEIETDKTSMEVPATSAGVLAEIRVATGDVAPVGAVVAVLAASAEAAEAHQPAAKQSAQPQAPLIPAQAGIQNQTSLDPRFRGDERIVVGIPAAKPIPMDLFREVRTPERNYGPARIGGISVTPLARRLAGENGIDLSRITGSGPHGRIVARDVEGQIRRAPAGAPAAGPSASDILALYRDVPFNEVPLDGMRKTIAARLTQAKQIIPHFYLNADVSIDALLKLRAEANAAAPRPDGAADYRISVNDFVIKALALALIRVPATNAVWADDRILRFNRADIGVAVAIDGGLLTPVLRAANEKSLSAISNEMRSLAERARDKKLKPEEYQGGVSAISNLGMYGVRDFAAIINPPQSTILAVGASQRRPVETEDGGVRFESQMTITLSCDHRVIDGALGAQLLAAVKNYLEQPLTMLVA
ncbi:pyruvate dehydrogenase complex dihydrolipoamide acetyltransferase [Pseudorhodoplanes sinuspersici]|uniref:Acetyltransferase component of pyruvate dehydrogenase complex n=1 Tax=Pseudorhodoplanes sinuspersici TaxID=1235591 RepID=A0A1W6ZTU7_9HYPH|nr:pyruvate dehydrogenase complex dihydrolipoamide acetyltransferase [Pseudorhodoplanes sinuspersici]ARQ00551.1 pyruvate dehydrogenase complex dihydrolipoamide acetyltransferase [Pseudorhodoplanes sinuspersici]RKE72143.1 pyruvate dehydrogenase E2 component (dihydrolipoamide acetyltransferase) [Pseudorhodoplanes sinuspersici]